MRELDSCLRLAKLIKTKEMQICEIRARTMTPKNQVISDMPRGGGRETNAMDGFLIKIERMNNAKSKLQKQLDIEWSKALNVFELSGITRADIIELMRLRFYCGISWKKCAHQMQITHTDGKWDINKCFRAYRSVMHKTSASVL